LHSSSTELTVHFLIENSLQIRFLFQPLILTDKFNEKSLFFKRKQHVCQQIGKKTRQNEEKS